MPLIEFVGYSEAEAIARVERYKALLAPLVFARDIAFVVGSSRVIGLHGAEQPLVRVCSRFEERIEAVSQVLGQYEDIESIVVGFRPKSTSGTTSAPRVDGHGGGA